MGGESPQVVVFVITGIIALALLVFLLFLLRRRNKEPVSTEEVGEYFEQYCADLLQNAGFTQVELTKASGDFGVDIFARRDGLSWAFQCKCYDSPVGVSAVQEIYAGKAYFHRMVGVVMTNSTFTKAARELADSLNVVLWDGAVMNQLKERSR